MDAPAGPTQTHSLNRAAASNGRAFTIGSADRRDHGRYRRNGFVNISCDAQDRRFSFRAL